MKTKQQKPSKTVKNKSKQPPLETQTPSNLKQKSH